VKPDSGASRQMIRYSLNTLNTAGEINMVSSAVEEAVTMLRA
jgi:hypothetical protein